MVNQQLLTYVEQQVSAGVSREEIFQALRSENWLDEDINSAFLTAQSNLNPNSVLTPPTDSGPNPLFLEKDTQTEDVVVHTTNHSIGRKLLIFSLIIAVTIFFSVTAMTQFSFGRILSLFSSSLFFYAVLPTLLITALVTFLLYRYIKKQYRRSTKPIQLFFFGVSLYFLVVLFVLGIFKYSTTVYIKSVPPDLSFAVGLISSLVYVNAIYLFYIGLLVYMKLLISVLKSDSQSGTTESQSRSVIRYSMMGLAVLMGLYVFNIMTPVAVVLNTQLLCKLNYSTRAKSNCLVKTSPSSNIEDGTIDSSGEKGSFTIVTSPYSSVKDLQEIGGVLAYAYESDNGKSSGVVYNGEIVSKRYQRVGSLPIEEIGGTLAYEAVKEGKKIVVWNDKEYGLDYNMAFSATDVGGKLAYIAEKGVTKEGKPKRIVVWDGKEYGFDQFDKTSWITDVGDELVFAGKNASGSFVWTAEKQIGPYSAVRWIQEYNGHYVAMVSWGSDDFFIVDGVEVGRNSGMRLGTEYVFIDDVFAYSATKGEKKIIIYNGKEIGTEYKTIYGPYKINNKLGYMAVNTDGSSKMIIDGLATAPVYTDSILSVDVSENGRIAVRTSKTDRYQIVVYLDGEEVYRGKGGNPYGFFREKLLFWIERDGINALWYDGKIIGEGFYGYNYMQLVNGKLVVAAFAASKGPGGVEYSLLFEQ